MRLCTRPDAVVPVLMLLIALQVTGSLHLVGDFLRILRPRH
jgi:hypothetical protein